MRRCTAQRAGLSPCVRSHRGPNEVGSFFFPQCFFLEGEISRKGAARSPGALCSISFPFFETTGIQGLARGLAGLVARDLRGRHCDLFIGKYSWLISGAAAAVLSKMRMLRASEEERGRAKSSDTSRTPPS